MIISLGDQRKLAYQLNTFYLERVQKRNSNIETSLSEVCRVMHELFKEVEIQEPRFISTLIENEGRYEGLHVLSPTEFEIVLYLNQMGVFNFVDDGQIPGAAVLKLSDGRKRSMSLWVEFITASGYLSAKKIRSRFQALLASAVDKCNYRDIVKVSATQSEVKLRIKDTYTVTVSPAFRCSGIWPRSASHWPLPQSAWPPQNVIGEIKNEGFVLQSRETVYMREKQSNADGDAWLLSFAEPQQRLIQTGSGCRKKCLSILKTLRDQHLEIIEPPRAGPVINNSHMETMLLYECEKHPRDYDWEDAALGDRVNGVLLQLISCLQNRRCPHYFLPNVDMFKGHSLEYLDKAARKVWVLLRELLTNARALDSL